MYFLIWGAALLAAFFLFWNFYFLRNPDKNIPSQKNSVVSPADGLIVRIVPFNFSTTKKKVDKGMWGNVRFYTHDVAQSGYFIVIRLHLYDIHYQRSPVSGIVVRQVYTKGKFLNAVVDAEALTATFENEKNEILIEEMIGKRKVRVKIIQVAGFAARRIVSYVHEKQKIEKGELLGLINLGSQVILVVPKLNLQVKEGDRTSGGETLIGMVK